MVMTLWKIPKIYTKRLSSTFKYPSDRSQRDSSFPTIIILYRGRYLHCNILIKFRSRIYTSAEITTCNTLAQQDFKCRGKFQNESMRNVCKTLHVWAFCLQTKTPKKILMFFTLRVPKECCQVSSPYYLVICRECMFGHIALSMYELHNKRASHNISHCVWLISTFKYCLPLFHVIF